jgi:hypothetical protein
MAAIKEVLERNQLYAFGVEAPQTGNGNCTHVNTTVAAMSDAVRGIPTACSASSVRYCRKRCPKVPATV